MKKFYMLMGAALTAATAVAVVGQTNVANLTPVKVNLEDSKIMTNDKAVLSTETFSTRAGETVGAASVNSPFKMFFVGLSEEGSGYRNCWGFAPAFGGTLDFSGVAEGATTYKWNWNNGYKSDSPSYKDFEKEGSALSIDLTPASMVSDLMLTAVNGDNSQVATPVAELYMMGGSFQYYFGSSAAACGLTMYPPVGGELGGTYQNYNAYDKSPASAAKFDANGSSKDWPAVLPLMNKVGQATDYTDVKINSYGYIIPAQSSPYKFTKVFTRFKCIFSGPTTLKGTIYPVSSDNKIQMDKPIAKMTANVTKETVNYFTWNVVPVDQDGDEVEGDVIVNNTAIYIAVEDFASDPAVTQLVPIYGAGTSWPTADSKNQPYFRNSYVSLSYKYQGADKEALTMCPYNYYEDDERTTLWISANYLWMIDAVFPFVLNAETNGLDFDVEIPVAGGQKEVKADPFYYQLKLLVEGEAMNVAVDGNWISYEISSPDVANGNTTTITVKGTALPSGSEGRRGSITFTGMAQDFTINVTQGKVSSGVNDIVVDAEAAPVYYDLQGRKVVGTPDKGVYIVKQGNKVNKVIL